MFFNFRQKKTVKELRKNKCLTAKELAIKIKVETSEILKVDHLRLKDVSEPLRSKLTMVLTRDDTEKMPWL